MRRTITITLASVLGALLAAVGASAAPRVQMMVVGRKTTLLNARAVKLRAGTVKIGHRHCAVPAGTALSGLLSARLAPRVTDAGGCDPASMFVTRVRRDANHGQAGWEYKIGHAAPSFGAGDPGGRLHAGQQLLWFWCLRASSCQRTLSVTSQVRGVMNQFHVVGYDDNGHGHSVSGATVHIGSQRKVTNAHGWVSVALKPGNYQVFATKSGTVRSFPSRVGVAT
jgi:hypothetical protein